MPLMVHGPIVDPIKKPQITVDSKEKMSYVVLSSSGIAKTWGILYG